MDGKLEKFLALDPDGNVLDAEILFELYENIETYSVKARGGKKVGPSSLNPDYNEALEALLRNHKDRNSILEDILVDSTKVKNLPIEKKRVSSADYPLPLEMKDINDVSEYRRHIGNIVKNIGKEKGAKGGNSNKKLLIRFRTQQSKNYKNFATQELEKFHKIHFEKSGPPPSGKRKGSEKPPSTVGFVYAFWLKGIIGKNKNAIKVGYTGDLIARFKQLNKELRYSVTNLVWVEHTFFQFSNPTDAYNFEQDLHHLLQKYRYNNEREIYNLTTESFDQLLQSNGY